MISAEMLPDGDQKLRELVPKHKIHNICGDIYPSPVSMVKSDNEDSSASCSRKFSKCSLKETPRSKIAYHATHKIPDILFGGEYDIRRCLRHRMYVERRVDMGWIVPCNLKLLSCFQYQLNVELRISRVGGIKYLFKYICKVRERVKVEL